MRQLINILVIISYAILCQRWVFKIPNSEILLGFDSGVIATRKELMTPINPPPHTHIYVCLGDVCWCVCIYILPGQLWIHEKCIAQRATYFVLAIKLHIHRFATIKSSEFGSESEVSHYLSSLFPSLYICLSFCVSLSFSFFLIPIHYLQPWLILF